MTANDVAVALAWSAVRVTLLLLPAVLVHVLASRRGPAAGAWAAALGLGLVAVLSLGVFVPRPTQGWVPTPSAVPTPVRVERDQAGPRLSTSPAGITVPLGRLWRGVGWVAPPRAVRVGRWGEFVAALGAAGAAAGLVRLALGVWAVRLCRLRGRAVTDAALRAELDSLAAAMGCRRPVEVVEVADLTTPATAGWFRPVLFLPADWPAWDAPDRRAVLAHELAHVVRRDYAAGLLARVAVALQFYHPAVHWLASRLLLQQELAADALGARFSGGRKSYMLALSRLALRQDGRSPSWPARAFLPARGALIRRIAMLRDDTTSADPTTTMPAPGRLLSALGLGAVTLALLTLRGPARAGDGATPPPAPAPAAKPAPFDVSYISDSMSGAVAFRPAAVFARPGMADHARALRTLYETSLAAGLKVDPSKPGFPRVGPEDVEWVVTGFDVGRPGPLPKGAEGSATHSLVLGGLTVRATHPVDWLAVLRAWGFTFEEVREGGRVFHKVGGPLRSLLGPNDGCVYLPDDRTLVFNELAAVRAAVHRGPGDRFGLTPAEHAAVGLFVLANRDDVFTRKFEAGAKAGDEAVLSHLRRVDRWSIRVDDADTITLRGSAECRSPGFATGLAAELLALAAQGERLGDDPAAVAEGWRRDLIQKFRSAVAGLKARADGARVEASTGDFGTFAWFAPVLVGELTGQAPPQARPAEAVTRTPPEGAGPGTTRR